MSTETQSVQSSLACAPVGLAQRWTRTFIPTTKEAPSDAQAVSHKLLLRAGCIRSVGAGVYDYLPLAWRVLQKISAIVRQEMNAAGASEMLMPAMEPIEFFADTKRDIDYGDNLFTLTDRHGRKIALAPTHEEIITEMMKSGVTSYRQLPLGLYQIQTKFRDEFRPRTGLLRSREFIMKDAYTFHLNLEGAGGLDESYEAMRTAYINIFSRCGLDFSVVEAQAGPIGGSASHEFMVNCDAGEDIILRCPESGYAANVEKCEIGDRPWSFAGEPTGDLHKVHTPDAPSIEAVCKRIKVKPKNMLKTIVFQRQDDGKVNEGTEIGGTGFSSVMGRQWVVAVVRGDHDVNEGKVKDAAGGPIALADEAEARAAGFMIGYVSPRSVVGRADALLLVDPDAAKGMVDIVDDPDRRNARPAAVDTPDARPAGKSMFWAAGADEMDHHVKHFNWRRELGDVLDNSDYVKVADIRNAIAGDPSPKASGATLVEGRGIEVGHIFKLGTKYSEAMGFTVLDPEQNRVPVIMGCYGIGVSRTLQACVEMSNDADGIVWPAAIAPYHVLITPMKVDKNEPLMQTALTLADELAAAGVEVLIDDRDERAGVKFKDADLIGVPIRLTIGPRAFADGCVEFKIRGADGKGETVKIEDAAHRCVRMLREAVG